MNRYEALKFTPPCHGKKFDKGVNFELRKKAFDDKSGLYTYTSFHVSLYLEKREERVSER